MIYPNPKYKPGGGRGRKNEAKHEIAKILGITLRHARNMLNKGMTIEDAKVKAMLDRKAQGLE